jgi:CTP synthase (UTP-ammonia lyase)
VLGIADAEHEETAPLAANLMISRLACSLVGQEQEVHLLPGTRVGRAYGGRKTAREQFLCNFGLNPAYQERIAAGGLVISALDEAGEVRAVELPAFGFFIATLFLPQMNSQPGAPHPLIAAFLEASRG